MSCWWERALDNRAFEQKIIMIVPFRRATGQVWYTRKIRWERWPLLAVLMSGLATTPQAYAQLSTASNQLWTQDSQDVAGNAETYDNFGSVLAVGDFNGDDNDDLAIGVPGENIDAGVVNVLYGGGSGLRTFFISLWSQDSDDIQDTSETGDRFGNSLAAGDFNHDGYDDLAIGVPREDIDGIDAHHAGAVTVLYGSQFGISPSGFNNQLWTQDSQGVEGNAEPEDHFGAALAAGDFNGDGYDDLAIGVPGENIDAGAVNVLYGSENENGLSAVGDQLLIQGVSDVEDEAEDGDAFGAALAVGDFDNDGYDDLAIGVPGEELSGQNTENAGAVNVLYGTHLKFLAISVHAYKDDQLWSQDVPGVKGKGEWGDTFGHSLATGDFDGDGYDDLAIGVPNEGFEANNIGQAGAVNVLYGAETGVTEVGDQLWTQDLPGVKGAAESLDGFGHSLATGDFDGDGYDDLAIGVC